MHQQFLVSGILSLIMILGCSKTIVVQYTPEKILYKDNFGFPILRITIFKNNPNHIPTRFYPEKVTIYWGDGEFNNASACPNNRGEIEFNNVPNLPLYVWYFEKKGNITTHWHSDGNIEGIPGKDGKLSVHIRELSPCASSHCASIYGLVEKKVYWWNKEWWKRKSP